MNIFSDDARRNPYPLYAQMRGESPVYYLPPPFNGWLLFGYDDVKRALTDHLAFSSQVPAPRHWFVFLDPPVHTRLRALVSRAFTPHTVANLEPRIRELSRQLLAKTSSELEVAHDFSVPLPMKVISGMIGIPETDWQQFKVWSDSILKLSYANSGGPEAESAVQEFRAATAEMNEYLAAMIAERRKTPRDDLLTRLIQAEVEGERLTQEEILGFFQLLVVAGQETTTNLINNALICFLDHPGALQDLRRRPELLSSAIEEVLRYRSPLQWVMRAPRSDIVLSGQRIPAGQLLLPVIGSANRDQKAFPNAEQFVINREPNPHLAFGHGIHSCIGAALARMETRIALTEFFGRFRHFERRTADPWQPRKALHVHGPTALSLRVERA